MDVRLPQPVRDYLQEAVYRELRPLCLRLDAEHTLVRCWGEPADFGLAQLTLGASAPEQLPLLVGLLDAREPLELRFVEVSDGHVAHVHLLPDADARYLVLLGVDAEHAQVQSVQQRSHDASLRSLYDQRLVQELRRTQAELEQKKREAESASALKSHFIASMSHEFRTPLTSVIGYAELFESGEGLDPGQVQLCSSAVRRNAQHLLNLVDNILDEARLEADMLEIRPAPLRLAELVRTLREMFAPLSEEKGIAFTIELAQPLPECILVDGMRLRQVLINLLSNAVKFTDAGEVRLRLAIEAGALHVQITDTGPGIAPEAQRRIFAPFQRAGDHTRAGAGLGLSITRQLLERMGGSLELVSTLGAGTQWQLRMPVEVAAAPEGPAISEVRGNDPENAALSGRVLLLEDNPDITRLLELYLVSSDVELISCEHPLAALELLEGEQVDLVLVDLNLPQMDGFEFLRRLRASGSRIPAIAFSATAENTIGQRVREAGFAGFLAKPVKRPVLFAMLAQHLAGRAAPAGGGASAQEALELILARYQQSLPERRAEIAKLWRGYSTGADPQVFAELARTLHQLAGSAGSYGFEQVSAAAAAAARVTREEDGPEREELGATVAVVLAALDAAIDRRRAEAARPRLGSGSGEG